MRDPAADRKDDVPLGPRAHRQAERLAASLDGAPAAGPVTLALLATVAEVRALPLSVPARAAGSRDAALAAFTAGHAAGLTAALTPVQALAQPPVQAPVQAPATGSSGHGVGAHAAGAHLAGSGVLTGHGVLVGVLGGVTAVVVAAGTVSAVVLTARDRNATPSRPPAASPSVGTAGQRSLQAALGALAGIQRLAGGPATAATQTQIAALVDTLDRQVALATGDLLPGTRAEVAALLQTLAQLRAGLAGLPPLGGVAATAVARSQVLLARLAATVGALPLPPLTAPGAGTGPTSGGRTGNGTTPTAPGTSGSGTRPERTVGPSLPSLLPSGLPTQLPTQLPTLLPTQVSSILASLLPTLTPPVLPTVSGLP